MKDCNKILAIALLLSLIFLVGTVSAQEDITFEQSDVQTVSIETNNENSESISTEIDTQENENSPRGGEFTVR